MNAQIVNGTFKNTASTPFFIPIRSGISTFKLINLTMSGVTAMGVAGALTSNRIVEAFFNPTFQTNGTALIKQQGTVSGNLAPLSNGNLAQNGLTIVDVTNLAKGPNIAIASFVPGTTTTFTTSANHGFFVGDTVRIGSMTSAAQLGGLSMTVTAVGSPTTFTTLLNSSNALTSVGTVFKTGNALIPEASLYYPQNRNIAAITLANPMVVTTLVQQNYQVGDKVRFQIPTVFGMPQISSTTNGLPVEFTVIAANNAVGTQTVTLDVDSTGFTAFAWPALATAGSYPSPTPVMVPQGEGNINSAQAFGVLPAPLPYANQNILGFAKQNLACNGVLVGAGDGTNATTTGGLIATTVDSWYWEATLVNQTFNNAAFP